MLPLEAFWWYLLLLSVASLVVINVSLKTFWAVWLLPLVVSLRHQSTCCVTSCGSWSHGHTRASGWGVAGTLCHAYSRWRFELFNRLSVSHTHVLLLISWIYRLVLTRLILLLLIHIRTRMESTRRSLIVAGISRCIPSRSRTLTAFLLWVQTARRPHTHICLLWIILILHLIILILIFGLIIFALFSHSGGSLIIRMVLLSLWLILILVRVELLIANRI